MQKMAAYSHHHWNIFFNRNKFMLQQTKNMAIIFLRYLNHNSQQINGHQSSLSDIKVRYINSRNFIRWQAMLFFSSSQSVSQRP